MKNRYTIPPKASWNLVSFGFSIFLCCSGWSVARAKVYQLEVAQYKLQVGMALSEVKKVSDTLEQASNYSEIAPQEKQKIQQLTETTNAVLDAARQDFEIETDKLLKLDLEK